VPYRNWADTDTLNAADLNAMTADAVTTGAAKGCGLSGA